MKASPTEVCMYPFFKTQSFKPMNGSASGVTQCKKLLMFPPLENVFFRPLTTTHLFLWLEKWSTWTSFKSSPRFCCFNIQTVTYCSQITPSIDQENEGRSQAIVCCNFQRNPHWPKLKNQVFMVPKQHTALFSRRRGRGRDKRTGEIWDGFRAANGSGQIRCQQVEVGSANLNQQVKRNSKCTTHFCCCAHSHFKLTILKT